MKWTKSSDQDFEEDSRGWEKGRARTHTEEEKQLIKQVREELEKSDSEAYIGPEAILRHLHKNEKEYGKNNVNIDSINLSFITGALKDLGLSKPHRGRVKGGSEYQRYPKILIGRIGKLILEIDFLQRFIKGRAKPVNFIGFSCKPLRLRQYRRISGQTGINARKELEWFFENFFVPDAVKMDNGLAFIGSSSAKRTISETIKHLFNKKIIPIFTNPRSPWNNGSVEGSNSVFARNFWNKFEFDSIEEIERKLELFNRSSLEYSTYGQNKFRKAENRKFIPRIYFVRKVHEDRKKSGSGEINILNEQIKLPGEYVNLYTLSKWDLKEETLYVYFENEWDEILIKKVKFPINKNCQIKL